MLETDHRTPQPMDASVFRYVVGHLPSGVTVVTTEVDGRRFGMTASSVVSLSMDPPMMLACLNRATPTSGAVTTAGRFGVNVLRAGQEHVAAQFAGPRDDKFDGVEVLVGELGVPLLAEAVAHIECSVVEEITGGTHTIFLGRVATATAPGGRPLTYFRGGYGRFESTRDDEVYHRARRAVLRRGYAAEAVLTVRDLAAELDTDHSHAFYALTRLTTDGLVYRSPLGEYVVVPFDARTADETFEARRLIETGVVRAVIGRIPAAELEHARAAFDAMAALLVGDRFVDFDRYLDANYVFHEAVVALAHNRALTASFDQLSIKSVMASSFGSTPVTSEQFIEVQRGLIDGLERVDLELAIASIRNYTEMASARVRQIIAEAGGQI